MISGALLSTVGLSGQACASPPEEEETASLNHCEAMPRELGCQSGCKLEVQHSLPHASYTPSL